MAFSVSQKIQTICRFVLYAVNAFFFPIALIVMGVGLYLLLYKGDLLSVVFEMNYIQDSIIIIIFCGAAILLLAIFGLVANRLADFRVLAVYCILLLITALLLIIAGVIGIVFKSTWYIDEVRQEMKDRVQQNYGIDLNTSEYNAHITRTWDTMQEWWYCCAVEDNSWGVYRQSEWYNQQPGDPGTKELIAKMVPLSCCTKSQYGYYIDTKKCQNWILGPPNKQTGTQDENEAVHYKGCFTAGSEVLDLVSSGVMGIGFGIGVILFAGIVPAAILVLATFKNKPLLPPQANSSRDFYAPSTSSTKNRSYDNSVDGPYDNPYVTPS